MRIVLELQLPDNARSGAAVGKTLMELVTVLASRYDSFNFDEVAKLFPKHEPYGTILQETRERQSKQVVFRAYLSEHNINPNVVQDSYIAQRTGEGLAQALVRELIKKASEKK